MVKQCYKCHRELPLDAFWPHHGRPDGLQTACQECQKKREVERRQAMPEYYRRKHSAFYYAHREQIIRKRKEEYEVNKEKHSAQSKARYAVLTGKLQKQPCEICGTKAEIHHPDYSKPLEVRWFCRRHHQLLELAKR